LGSSRGHLTVHIVHKDKLGEPPERSAQRLPKRSSIDIESPSKTPSDAGLAQR
jgi:hypothetical protein